MKRRDFCGAVVVWPTFGWAHSGHGHSALEARVQHLRRAGADVVIDLTLHNRSKAALVVQEAYVFGSAIRRQSFPATIPAQAEVTAEVVLQFNGRIPGQASLILLHAPGGKTELSVDFSGI